MIDNIYKSIYKSIDEVNSQMSKDEQLIKSPDTVLYGESSSIDSIGLINIIVTVEQNIEDDFEKSITLADQKAMSQKQSPFKTVESLAKYIQILIEEKKNE
jgi:acyl carrier protein|tara:strand:+ start:133 stop:435 length:303 start_codon:yes stop_codon:yes gene_type:complete